MRTRASRLIVLCHRLPDRSLLKNCIKGYGFSAYFFHLLALTYTLLCKSFWRLWDIQAGHLLPKEIFFLESIRNRVSLQCWGTNNCARANSSSASNSYQNLRQSPWAIQEFDAFISWIWISLCLKKRRYNVSWSKYVFLIKWFKASVSFRKPEEKINN